MATMGRLRVHRMTAGGNFFVSPEDRKTRELLMQIHSLGLVVEVRFPTQREIEFARNGLRLVRPPDDEKGRG